MFHRNAYTFWPVMVRQGRQQEERINPILSKTDSPVKNTIVWDSGGVYASLSCSPVHQYQFGGLLQTHTVYSSRASAWTPTHPAGNPTHSAGTSPTPREPPPSRQQRYTRRLSRWDWSRKMIVWQRPMMELSHWHKGSSGRADVVQSTKGSSVCTRKPVA